jgi:superfamily II DNA/RNA helicase
VLAAFRKGQVRTLVATDIAARGIDVDGISHVVNYDLPNIPETYVHRIGRTARAGADGVAISLCDAEEASYLRDIEKLIRMPLPMTDRRSNPRPDQQPASQSREARPFGRPPAKQRHQRNGSAPRNQQRHKPHQRNGGESRNEQRHHPHPRNGGEPRPQQHHESHRENYESVSGITLLNRGGQHRSPR